MKNDYDTTSSARVGTVIIESGEAGKLYSETFRAEPDAAVFVPYRICPLGAHVDHNLGRITGFAIDRGIRAAYGASVTVTADGGMIEAVSRQFEGRASWNIADIPPQKLGDWADHLRGATLALSKRYRLERGIRIALDGELPIGGLSSSAAVTIAFLTALSRVNGIALSGAELIDLALEAENAYVGVSCGRLDQSCEVYCRRDHLLYMDMKTGERELIPQPPEMEPYEFLILYSGIGRSLSGSGYNMRVDEARAAAYAMLAFGGREYGKISETNLRDVPEELFARYGEKLPEPWRRRARHWYTENARVLKGTSAWRRGDITEFGKLVSESGRSSIYDWETGCPELQKLYEILTHTDGVYGGRFSGAGFKGCFMAIIDPSYRGKIIARAEREYLDAFPHLRGRYASFVCHSADGVSPDM